MSRRRFYRREEPVIVEEVVVEHRPMYEEEAQPWWVGLISLLVVIAIIGGLAYFLLRPRPVRYVPQPGMVANQPSQTMQAVPIGTPTIDLQAVEKALWATQASNQNDFKGWMEKFEDEVNAVYFATLRSQNPQADPATLMKKPVRVDAQRHNNLLHLYGYLDDNNKPGYQNGEDKLLFVFQQTQPYNSQQRQLSYALRDGGGYYYRDPSYTHAVAMAATPMFLGFFLFPAIWYGMYYRPMFGWWGTPYWRSGPFYSRYTVYRTSYASYHSSYRSNYYTRSRPWGWNRGAYYRSRPGGGYYRPGTTYRSTGTTGSRYRSTGGTTGSYRYRSTGGSRYRSSGSSGRRRR